MGGSGLLSWLVAVVESAGRLVPSRFTDALRTSPAMGRAGEGLSEAAETSCFPSAASTTASIELAISSGDSKASSPGRGSRATRAAISGWPEAVARSVALRPSASVENRLEPISTKSFTDSVWPFSAAIMSGVRPSSIRA